MLQWLRRIKSKKSFRVFLVIGIAVLSVGLVGSFAIWSLPNLSSSQANDKSPTDSSEQYQQLEEQIAQLEKSVAEKKNDPKLLEKLGNAYYDLGYQMFMDKGDAKTVAANLDSALKNYEAALELDPDNVPLILQAASTATGVADTDKAEAFYKKALAIEPNAPENRLAYANFLLYVSNDYDGAKKELQTALTLKPDKDTKLGIEAMLEQVDQLEKSQNKAESKSDK